jgi:hypothetical protein
LYVRAEKNEHIAFFFDGFLEFPERGGEVRVELPFARSEPADRLALRARRHLHQLRRLAVNLARAAVDDVQPLPVMAEAGAYLPRDQRILVAHIVANEENRLRIVEVGHRRGRIGRLRSKGGSQAGVIRGAVVIDVVGSQAGAREAIQQIIFFIGRVIRADHPNRLSPILIVHLLQPARDFFESFLPACRVEAAIPADERLANAFGM